MTPPTPIRQPPLEDLQNAIQTALLYEADGTHEQCKNACARVRILVQSALDKLGEPHALTVEAAKGIMGGIGIAIDDREAKDVAAIVTHTALTWGSPRVW